MCGDSVDFVHFFCLETGAADFSDRSPTFIDRTRSHFQVWAHIHWHKSDDEAFDVMMSLYASIHLTPVPCVTPYPVTITLTYMPSTAGGGQG
jgi:hypothetical protein